MRRRVNQRNPKRANEQSSRLKLTFAGERSASRDYEISDPKTLQRIFRSTSAAASAQVYAGK
jgi:hypothetical protein